MAPPPQRPLLQYRPNNHQLMLYPAPAQANNYHVGGAHQLNYPVNQLQYPVNHTINHLHQNNLIRPNYNNYVPYPAAAHQSAHHSTNMAHLHNARPSINASININPRMMWPAAPGAGAIPHQINPYNNINYHNFGNNIIIRPSTEYNPLPPTLLNTISPDSVRYLNPNGPGMIHCSNNTNNRVMPAPGNVLEASRSFYTPNQLPNTLNNPAAAGPGSGNNNNNNPAAAVNNPNLPFVQLKPNHSSTSQDTSSSSRNNWKRNQIQRNGRKRKIDSTANSANPLQLKQDADHAAIRAPADAVVDLKQCQGEMTANHMNYNHASNIRAANLNMEEEGPFKDDEYLERDETSCSMKKLKMKKDEEYSLSDNTRYNARVQEMSSDQMQMQAHHIHDHNATRVANILFTPDDVEEGEILESDGEISNNTIGETMEKLEKFQLACWMAYNFVHLGIAP